VLKELKVGHEGSPTAYENAAGYDREDDNNFSELIVHKFRVGLQNNRYVKGLSLSGSML